MWLSITWIQHRGKPNEVQEKLNQALASDAWLTLFSHGSLKNVFAHVSDHSTIILLIEEHVSFCSNRSFKFENNWFCEPGLMSLDEGSWHGSFSLYLLDHLSEVLGCLQRWGRELNASFRKEVKMCNERLEQLKGSTSNNDVAQFEDLKSKLVYLLIKEKDHWRQCAKVYWLQKGDCNTKFFHSYAN